MGLNFRKKSGKIANGSRLVVDGQVTQGQKVFPVTFNQKTNPYDRPASTNNNTNSQSGSQTN